MEPFWPRQSVTNEGRPFGQDWPLAVSLQASIRIACEGTKNFVPRLPGLVTRAAKLAAIPSSGVFASKAPVKFTEPHGANSRKSPTPENVGRQLLCLRQFSGKSSAGQNPSRPLSRFVFSRLRVVHLAWQVSERFTGLVSFGFAA